MLAGRALASIRGLAARLRTAVRNTIFGAEILEGLARVGHATRGLIYVFLGLLAMASALSDSRPPSLAGAFSIVDHLPGGWFLLLAVALGLFAYGGWRGMQALLDLTRCGWHARGLLRRAGMLAQAILYAGLGVLAAVISLSRNTEVRDQTWGEAHSPSPGRPASWTGRWDTGSLAWSVLERWR